MVASLRSHRTALRLRGVPWLRTVLRSVCSPLQPFGPPTFASSLAAFLALLGSSYRPALRWPGIPGLRSASRCPRPSTPSGLRRLRPVSRTARGLRAPPLHKGGSGVVLLPTVAPLTKRLPFPQRGTGSEAELRGRPCGLRSVSSGLRLSRALPWVFDGLWPPGFSGGHALWVME